MIKHKSLVIGKLDAKSFLCIASLIILTLPRFADSISPSFSALVNFLKICAAAYVLLAFIFEKPKVSTFSKIILLYFVYLFIVTLANNVSLMTMIKTYGLNAASLLLIEIIMNSKRSDRIITFFTNYFLVLLGLNFIQVCLYGLSNTLDQTYILGMDNRFILYTLLTVVSCCYLKDRKARTYKKYLAYILGFLSVLFTWSVAAVCIMGLMILASLYFERKKAKISLNAKLLGIIIIVFSAALVLFKFHEGFWPVIESVIHKNSSLSYRTYIWDVGIGILRENPINLIFGFGFFDVSGILSVIPYLAAHVIHFHNILVEVIFSGGVVGLLMYLCGLFYIGNGLDQFKKRDRILGNQLIIVFLGLLALMAFDVFEYYQVYYVVLILLLYASLPCLEHRSKGISEYEKKS